MWRLRRLSVGTAGLLATATIAAVAATGCSDQGPTSSTATGGSTTIPMIVDYSPTVSDVGALAYLATHPHVDLRAITLAGTGESRCDAAVANTVALVEALGHHPVPVACGPEEAIGPGNEWPADWRDAADRLDGLHLPHVEASAVDGAMEGDAITVLTETAAAVDDVVIVALGPLTNLAGAVEADPDFAENVTRTFTMGGAIAVAGNAPNGTAEWNYFVDPEAVDVVVRSGMPLTLVPLDATDALPANRGWYERVAAASTPAADIVADLWEAARPWETGFFLWDELTAALATDTSLAPTTTTRVRLVVDGDDAGRLVVDPGGAAIQVAAAPDRRTVEDELIARLTSDEPSS